ncbi:MAG: hypothetical protein R2857_12080 [Vampirovibrionales bacterium]
MTPGRQPGCQLPAQVALDTLFTPSGKQSWSQRIDDTKLTAMANACVARATNRTTPLPATTRCPLPAGSPGPISWRITPARKTSANWQRHLQRRQDAISFGEDTPLSVLYKFSASAPYTTGSAGGIATTVPGRHPG